MSCGSSVTAGFSGFGCKKKKTRRLEGVRVAYKVGNFLSTNWIEVISSLFELKLESRQEIALSADKSLAL
jgi:hypothetical protein